MDSAEVQAPARRSALRASSQSYPLPLPEEGDEPSRSESHPGSGDAEVGRERPDSLADAPLQLIALD